MVYIKVLDHEGEVQRVDALDDPFYVHYERGVLTRCREADAEGMLLDSELVVNYGAGLGAELTAVVIPIAEYDTLLVEAPDPEDNDPEVPEGTTAEHIPTRAELAQRVATLEEENADLREALDMILNGVTE